jgi:hypothetical protein
MMKERYVPAAASTFHKTNLVSGLPGLGRLNPRGIAYRDPSGFNDAKFTKLGPTVQIPDGVRVAAFDATGTGKILIATAPDRGSTQVTLWDPTKQTAVGSFQGADPAFTDGIFLGGGLY